MDKPKIHTNVKNHHQNWQYSFVWCAQCSCQNCYSFVFYFRFFLCSFADTFSIFYICNNNNNNNNNISIISELIFYLFKFLLFLPLWNSHLEFEFCMQNFIFNSYSMIENWICRHQILNLSEPKAAIAVEITADKDRICEEKKKCSNPISHSFKLVAFRWNPSCLLAFLIKCVNYMQKATTSQRN